MTKTEYYQRLARKHGQDKVIAVLVEIIGELRAVIKAQAQESRRRALAATQTPRQVTTTATTGR